MLIFYRKYIIILSIIFFSCQETLPTTSIDCNGEANGHAKLDECGVCLEPTDDEWNSSCSDCSGIVNGSAFIDDCGYCICALVDGNLVEASNVCFYPIDENEDGIASELDGEEFYVNNINDYNCSYSDTKCEWTDTINGSCAGHDDCEDWNGVDEESCTGLHVNCLWTDTGIIDPSCTGDEACDDWHEQEVDGQNRDQIRNAIRLAQMEIEKPSIIIGHNVIAPGCATMEGDHNTHGAPLPPEEIAKTKNKLELDPGQFYHVSKDVLSDFRESYEYARQEVKAWNFLLDEKMKDQDFKICCSPRCWIRDSS